MKVKQYSQRFFWLLFVLVVLFIVPAALAQAENPPIELPALTALSLVTIITTIITVALDYSPFLAVRYDALTDARKRLTAAILAVVIVVGVFILTCAGIVSTNLVCTYTGAYDAFTTIIWAFIVGQGIHMGTKPTAKFKTENLGILSAAPQPKRKR